MIKFKKIVAVLLFITLLLQNIGIIEVKAVPIDTPDNVILISTANELMNISNNLTASYKLAADIDLNNELWTPIGTSAKPFKGLFDGGGYSIKNLKIDMPKASYTGLFGYASGAAIKNIRLQNVSIFGSNYTGGIVGRIENGTIMDSSVTGLGSINGAESTGGLAGAVSYTEIERCYVTVDTKGTNNTGGLIGYVNSSNESIFNCYAINNVKGSLSGGLVGNISSSATRIINCYSVGEVSGSTKGGLIGNSLGKIANSYFDSDISQITVPDSQARTTEQLNTIDTFKNWRFDTVWTMNGTKYPQLNNMIQPYDSAVEEMTGNGTAENPYQIKTASQLKKISNNLSASYKLMADIDLNNMKWTPIGTSSSDPFKGSFDGNGYVIKNITIIAHYTYTGLFGHASGATLKNVRLQNAYIFGDNYTGGIVGRIENGTIMDSSVTGLGSINGAESTGGLAGSVSYTEIERCYVTVDTNGTNNTGGLIGYVNTSNESIFNCYAINNVKGSEYTGGLVGNISSSATRIINCYSVGEVSGSTKRGLIGNGSGKIANSYFDSDISQITVPDSQARTTEQLNTIDTFIKWRFDTVWTMNGTKYPQLNNMIQPYDSAVEEMTGNGTAENPYQIKTASQLKKISNNLSASYKLMADIDLNNMKWTPIGTSSSDSFKGSFDGNGYVIKNITIIANYTYTGLFGYASQATLKNVRLQNAYIFGNNYTGGIVGRIENGTIMDSSVTGLGSINGAESTGGLAGSVSYTQIERCYVTVDTNGTNYTGGLIGYVNTSNEGILNCYTRNTVKGSEYTGGLIGYVYSSATRILNCYSVGALSGSTKRGLVGNGSGKITNSYFNSDTSQITGPDTQARTTVLLKKQSTYANWDFENIWIINEGYDYPCFTALNFTRDKLDSNELNPYINDPVDMINGNLIWEYADLGLYGSQNLIFKRTYNSKDSETTAIGCGWRHSFDYSLNVVDGYTKITIPNGYSYFFEKKNGSYTSSQTSDVTLIKTLSGYEFTSYDKTKYMFDNNYNIIKIKFPNENSIDFEYTNGLVTKISNNAGSMSFTYNEGNITEIKDNFNRVVSYEYDVRGNLVKFINADNDCMTFSYDENHKLLEVSDFNQNVYLKNVYQGDKVIEQYLADQGTSYYTYDFENRINTFTNALGVKTYYHYDSNNSLTMIVDGDDSTSQEFENGRLMCTIDYLGNKTSYEYDSFGNRTKTIYPDGTDERAAYNDKNLVTQKIARDGGVTSYEYDSRCNVLSITDANKNKRSFDYDVNNNMIRYTDSLGNQTLYSYDASGNRISITDALGNITSFVYDGLGRLIEQRSPKGEVKKYEYSPAGKLLKVIDALGNEQSFECNGDGYITSTTDVSGNNSQAVYNQMNRPISVTDPEGNTVYYKYNELGDMTNTIDAKGNSSAYSYDHKGRLLSMTDALGNQWRYKYDGNGQLVQTSDPFGNETYTQYNEMGEAVKTVNAANTEKSFQYDKAGRLIFITDELSNSISYAYDENGNLLSHTDKNRNISKNVYDSENRIIKSIDALGYETRYEYNTVGQLVKMISPEGAVSTYAYDADGQLYKFIDPMDQVVENIYDPLGRLVQKINPDGTSVSYEYDKNGLLLKSTDENGNAATYRYNKNGQMITMIDPMGRSYLYFYDENGNVITSQSALGHTTSYQYDPLNRLISYMDAEGNSTTYTYNALGQTTSVTDPKGGCIELIYDTNGNIIELKDALGNKTFYTYNSINQKISETNSLDQSIYYNYDANGNIIEIKDDQGNITTYQYDALNRLTQTTNALGAATTFSLTASGYLAAVTDALGQTMSGEYDKNGRIIKQTDGNGQTTSYQYDDMGRIIKETDSLGFSRSFAYNFAGQIINETDKNGNSTSYQYNADGRLAQTIDALGYSTKMEYNDDGQLIRITDANDNTTEVTYDKTGHMISLINPLGYSNLFEYDENGNLTKRYDANGVLIETNGYDAMNNCISITDALGNTKRIGYDNIYQVIESIDALNQSIRYTYDSLGHLTKAFDSENGEVSYTYDALGNITSLTDANENTNAFIYDSLGRMIREETAIGQSKQYEYDANSRLLTYINGRGQPLACEYDEAGRMITSAGVSYTYDPNGNVLTVNNENGTTTRTYDALNRVASYTDTHGYTISYTYDPVGNLTAITYPGGELVAYVYDAANQLIQVTDYKNRTTKYQYNPNGLLETTDYSNGAVETIAYDLAWRMIQKDITVHGRSIAAYRFSYDANGNIIEEREESGILNQDQTIVSMESDTPIDDSEGVIMQMAGSAYISQMYYDKNGRLIRKQDSDMISKDVPDHVYSYQYDAGGNMIQSIVSYGETILADNHMVYGKGNQLAEYNGQSVSYDADGNMIYGPLKDVFDTYQYDALNRLISAGDTAYGYDGENHRVSQTSQGETTVYVTNPNADLTQLLMQVNPDGSKILYVYGIGLISQEMVNGTEQEVDINLELNTEADTYRLYHYDYRGSTIAMSDINANITDRITYEAYGEVVERIGTTQTPFLYVGREGLQTDANGIYYMRARYYDPRTSHMLSEDPIRAGLNWYTYCNGNPINFIDSSGLEPVPLKETAENAGYLYRWDNNTKTGFVRSMSSISMSSIDAGSFFPGDAYGTYIDSNGIMMVDDLHLNNILYPPFGPAYIMYGLIKDDFGKYILRNWLDGDGSDVSFDGGRWGKYISDNNHVRDHFKELAQEAINSGSTTINNVSLMRLTDYGGGYRSGYELINGSNNDVGGFIVTGDVRLVNNAYQVDLQFSFNDIIDPNPIHPSDENFEFLSNLFGYNCEDYNLTITGNYSFSIKREEKCLK